MNGSVSVSTALPRGGLRRTPRPPRSVLPAMSIQTPTRPDAGPVEKAREGGEQVARSKGFGRLARAGFVARGTVYVVIGILAIRLALGVPGSNASQQGALRAIAAQPFGNVLLVLVAIGLGGYSLWRLVRAALGHGPEGADRGLDRLAALASGVVYAVLCAIAVSILVGGGSGSSGGRSSAGGVFGWPGGVWLVGIAGVVLLGVGAYQGYRGLSREFLDDSKTGQMSPRVRPWFEGLGLVGHLARAVVFELVGVFLLVSAVTYDPNKAVGLDGALAKLAHATYGPFLLGLVAAGLIAFGAYSLADARYRRV